MYGLEPKNDQIFLWMILKIIKNLKKNERIKKIINVVIIITIYNSFMF